jgi:hypothetical protein
MKSQSHSSTPAAADLSGAAWRKSSRSQGSQGDCVELASGPNIVGVRDSKDPRGPKLAFDQAAFAEFVAEVKQGGHAL